MKLWFMKYENSKFMDLNFHFWYKQIPKLKLAVLLDFAALLIHLPIVNGRVYHIYVGMHLNT